MLTPTNLIISLLCGGLLGLAYGYSYKKALSMLQASLSNSSMPAPSDNFLKQRVIKSAGLFFILRCFFVLGAFASLYIYLAVNILLCGLAFIVAFLSTTLILARK